jgi:hypothetical protein
MLVIGVVIAAIAGSVGAGSAVRRV